MSSQGLNAANGSRGSVFIAHAHADRVIVTYIGSMLRQAGYRVWWDQEIKGGKAWRDEILRHLSASDCVVVFWSKDSYTRDWVLDEAEYGKARRRLVPIRIDNSPIPMGFGGVQAVDFYTSQLSSSTGMLSETQTRSLNQSFAKLTASIDETIASAPRPQGKARGSSDDGWGCAALIVIAIIAGFWYFSTRANSSQTPQAGTSANVAGVASAGGTLIADSTRDFTGGQGVHGWYYLWEGRSGRNSFRWEPLPGFDGMCWRSNSNETDIRMCPGGEVHPGLTSNVAYGWVSGVQGRVRVVTHVQKIDTRCGDGVELVVYKGNQPATPNQWISGNDARGVDGVAEISVVPGDGIYVILMIHNESTCDRSQLSVKVYQLQ